MIYIISNKNALTTEESIQIINVLTLIRHGIMRMHPVFKERVDSSNNLGIVSLKFNKKENEENEAEVSITCYSRGATNTEFDKIENSMRAIFELCPIRNEFNTYIGSRPWPPKENSKLAFDHPRIITAGIERLRNKLNYTDVVFNMMPKYFTLKELQQVYEIIIGKKLLDPAFRRIIKNKVIKTDQMKTGEGHRPSVMFSYNSK